MERFNSIGIAGALAAAFLSAGVATADTLTYEGILVASGEINGMNLTGQTATVSIEFSGDLIAFDSGNSIVFDLGVLLSATYTFSGAGAFSVDVTQDGLRFGSPGNFDLAFYDSANSAFGMLSGTTAGNVGLVPQVGETMEGLFQRLSAGSTIAFLQSTNFQMLNPLIGGLNGGQDFVTTDIVGSAGSQVTLAHQPSGIGTNYCGPAALNTTGMSGLMAAGGSVLASDMDLTLTGSLLPQGEFAYFLGGPIQGFIAFPGGSSGNLCVVGIIARFNLQIGQISAAGEFSIVVDTQAIPLTPSVAIMPGDTWNFQCWHRDFIPMSGPTSNFTDGISITFL